MEKKPASLLRQIDAEALDPSADIVGTLRKCISLGGQTRSAALRDWATRELKGYDDGVELPGYRVVGALIALDGISGNYRVTGQQISAFSLPPPANKTITNEVHLRHALPQLAHLVEEAAKREETSAKFGLPFGAELVALMNDANESRWQHVERVYWQVSISALATVVDVVRTTLVELVSEMRSGVGDDDEVPTKEVADQAVSVAIYGDSNRVTLGVVGHSAKAGPVSLASGEPESRARRVMWWIVGAAAVIGTVATVLTLWFA